MKTLRFYFPDKIPYFSNNIIDKLIFIRDKYGISVRFNFSDPSEIFIELDDSIDHEFNFHPYDQFSIINITPDVTKFYLHFNNSKYLLVWDYNFLEIEKLFCIKFY